MTHAPLQIAFVSPELSTPTRPDGGLANYLRKVTTELATRGHAITVFAPSTDAAERLEDGVRVVSCPMGDLRKLRSLPGLRTLGRLFEDLLLSRRLASACLHRHRRSAFDLVQAASYRASGSSLTRSGRIPVVTRISSYPPLLRAADGQRRSGIDSITDHFEIQQVARSRAAFAPSAFMVRTYDRLEGIAVDMVRSPVLVRPLASPDAPPPEPFAGRDYLLFFGTLKRLKGIDLISTIVTPLLQRHPALHFAFVGRDLAQHGATRWFERICAANPAVRSRLLHSPAVPWSTLQPILCHARLVVMPSRVDNYPNACLEALACGVPVVGSSESSIDEMIEEGRTGHIVENGSAEALLAGIERHLDLPSVAQQAMRAAARSAAECMAAEDRIQTLIDYYYHACRTPAPVRSK